MRYEVRYKCRDCDNYENDDYRFIDCCRKCGRSERYYRDNFDEEVGHWVTETEYSTRTEKFLWWEWDIVVPKYRKYWVPLGRFRKTI